ncbi:MAG: Phosphoribosyl 1,2-cyclic phosphate 1,2-diphosphodiesterase [Firmicutes bacterium]|nr:Phosphoribosyl 1,2-cyclic phosphate 1,2-diphosphodiesterase [Bacillota bacterium]
MSIDMHVHTHISDSDYSIAQTLGLAESRGVSHIAITDHDTVSGVGRALELGKALGISVIPGVEISAFDFKRKKKAHILGYNFVLPAPAITRLCAPLLMRRRENSLWQLATLSSLGYDISPAEVLEKARHSTSIYKAHMMEVLINKGYGQSDYVTLYRQLFSKDGLCARDILYVDVHEAIQAVKEDGGQAIFAHPGQEESSFDLIEELWDTGLDGIELHHCDNSPVDKATILALAKQRHLILTAGSDFHGNYGSKVDLGDLPAMPPHTNIGRVLDFARTQAARPVGQASTALCPPFPASLPATSQG